MRVEIERESLIPFGSGAIIGSKLLDGVPLDRLLLIISGLYKLRSGGKNWVRPWLFHRLYIYPIILLHDSASSVEYCLVVDVDSTSPLHITHSM